MSHGGFRQGAGRKPGSTNLASMRSRLAAAESGELPHQFLLRVARGEIVDDHQPTFAERVDAAKAAAPYFSARLASTKIEQIGKPLQLAPPNADPRFCTDGQLIGRMLEIIAMDAAAWEKFARNEAVISAISEHISEITGREGDE